MDKKIIGFDMDGVILDHSQLKMKLAAEKGFDLQRFHTQSEVFKQKLAIPLAHEILDVIYQHPQVALEASLMNGVESSLEKIAEGQVSYFLISRRRDPEIAKKVLHKHNLWPKYFNDGNAFFVEHAEDKNVKAEELGITHYFDDENKVLHKLEYVKNKFLFDPFNAFENNTPFSRVRSWEEVVKHIL